MKQVAAVLWACGLSSAAGQLFVGVNVIRPSHHAHDAVFVNEWPKMIRSDITVSHQRLYTSHVWWAVIGINGSFIGNQKLRMWVKKPWLHCTHTSEISILSKFVQFFSRCINRWFSKIYLIYLWNLFKKIKSQHSRMSSFLASLHGDSESI